MDKEIEVEGLAVCSKCLLEIPEETVYWTDPEDNILCKECMPKGAKPIGLRH